MLKFFDAHPDTESGAFLTLIRDPGWRTPDPGKTFWIRNNDCGHYKKVPML